MAQHKIKKCNECFLDITGFSRKCSICGSQAHNNCSTSQDRTDMYGSYYCRLHRKLIPASNKRGQMSINSPQQSTSARRNQEILDTINTSRDESGYCRFCSAHIEPDSELNVNCILCLKTFHVRCALFLDKSSNSFDSNAYECFECKLKTRPQGHPLAESTLNGSSQQAQASNASSVVEIVPSDTESSPTLQNINSYRHIERQSSERPNALAQAPHSSSTNANATVAHVTTAQSTSAATNSFIRSTARIASSKNNPIVNDNATDKSYDELVRQLTEIETAKRQHTRNNCDRIVNVNLRTNNHILNNQPPVQAHSNVTHASTVSIEQFNDLKRRYEQLLQSFNNNNHNIPDQHALEVPHNEQIIHQARPNVNATHDNISVNNHVSNENNSPINSVLEKILLATLEQSKQQSELVAQTRLDRLKSENQHLHKVKEIYIDWPIFYRNYVETKNYFTANENANRVREALADCSIIKDYGVNLVNPGTCEATLARINQDLGSSDQLLIKQYHAIVNNQKRIHSNDKTELIAYIQKIINYVDICSYLGPNYTYASIETIARFTNILPPSLSEKWNHYASVKEQNNEIITLITLSSWLKSLLPGLNRMRISMQIASTPNEVKNNAQSSEQSRKKSRPFLLNNHNELYNVNEIKKFCWLHKNSEHYPSECHILLSKSGEEVSELAKQNNICVICGRTKHDGTCFDLNKIRECSLCSRRHRQLFCYKRQVQPLQSQNKETPTSNDNLDLINNFPKRLHAHENLNNHEDSASSVNNAKANLNNQFSIRANESTSTPHVDQSHLHNRLRNGDIRNPNNIPYHEFYINHHHNYTFVQQHNDSIHYQDEFKIENLNTHPKVNYKTSASLIAVVVLKLANHPEELAFLLDSGSTVSVIEESVANELKLVGYKQPLSIGWTGTTCKNDENSRLTYTIAKSMGYNSKEFLLFFHTMKNLNVRDQKFNHVEMQHLYSHLKKLNLTSYRKIVGILGTDQSWIFQFSSVTPKILNPDTPIGLRSPLGDCVVGNGLPISTQFSNLKYEKTKKLFHVSHFTSHANLSLGDYANDISPKASIIHSLRETFNFNAKTDENIKPHDDGNEIIAHPPYDYLKLMSKENFRRPVGTWKNFKRTNIKYIKSKKKKLRRNHSEIKKRLEIACSKQNQCDISKNSSRKQIFC